MFCGKHLLLWKVICSIMFKLLLFVIPLSWLVISCQRLNWHIFICGKSREIFICGKSRESVWMNRMFCFSSIALNQESNDYKIKLRKCFWWSDNHFLQKGQWVMRAPAAESKFMQLLTKRTPEPDKFSVCLGSWKMFSVLYVGLSPKCLVHEPIMGLTSLCDSS